MRGRSTPATVPTRTFRCRPQQIEAGREAAGRADRPFDLPACFWVSIADDRVAGRAALAEKLAYYGPSISPVLLAQTGLTPTDFEPAAALARAGRPAAALIDERMLALGIAGGPVDVVARCQALQALGADHLSFGPPLGPDPVAAVRLFGDQVLAELTGAPGGSPT